ncbi:hypothetical protein HRbin06_00892 [archaeon HR06]|nr:hypothetical protein HRbin06_00892 [archaeon HR06]
MNTLLIQVIGKLKGYDSVSYEIDSKLYTAQLVTEALEKYYINEKCDEVKRFIVVPESLITKLTTDLQECYDLIKEEKKLKEKFEKELKTKVIMMQSLGTYNFSNNFKITFENYPDNIVTYFLFDLIKIADGINNIILDISTGFNQYVISALESLRKYLVFKKLKNMIKGEVKDVPKVQISIIPPLPQSQNEQKDSHVKVNLYDFDVKAFFALPFKERNIVMIDKLVRNLTNEEKKKFSNIKEYKELKTYADSLLSTLKMCFNAINYNVPLALFYPEIININDNTLNNVKKCIEKIKYILIKFESELKKVELKKNEINIKRYNLSEAFFTNMLFSLALLESILNFWDLNLKDKINKPININVIEEKFTELYKNVLLILNEIYLKRDIEEIKALSKELSEGEERLLSELIKNFKCKEEKEDKIYSDKKRNFFAHSGFLKNITKVKKINNEILISYDFKSKNTINEIKNWISNP